jgi:hypothetical protein
MIVIAASLEPNDDQFRAQLPIESLVAPPGTVAVVLGVETPVYVTVDGSDPAENGLLLPQGIHQLPISEGGELRVSDGAGWVSVLWLRFRPRGPESA